MKFISLLLFCAVSLLPLRAQTGAASADADYAAFETLSKSMPSGSPKDIGAEKYMTWIDTRRQAVKTSALAFYAAYPTDPRRWDVVMTSVKAPPYFIKSFGPDAEKKCLGAIIADEAAVADWKKQADALTAAMLASTDAPAALREEAEWGLFAKDFRAGTAAMKAGQPVDWAALGPRFDAHAAKYPELGEALVRRADDYLGALAHNVPDLAAAQWTHLEKDSPNAALRQHAEEKRVRAEAMAKPQQMTFTAADGREVDLAKLRGKVVLVDFWATWCGPCKAELPNVVANYRKYHDQGFEVVGISLENASLAPKDTPAQKDAKLAQAKQMLTDFTTANDMPWPQYFDGKFWKNDISTKYAINSIPTMFLLDQDGKVVSTNARGPKLEAEIKRLLKP